MDGLRMGKSVLIVTPVKRPTEIVHDCQGSCGIFSHHKYGAQSKLCSAIITKTRIASATNAAAHMRHVIHPFIMYTTQRTIMLAIINHLAGDRKQHMSVVKKASSIASFW